ncbi:hypothetical protein [Vibrio sp. F74]|uniref:hypothetical protein n=1 Tax=Vibrio sp. F74 TaxID=700020 RepID=UPI0035F5606F
MEKIYGKILQALRPGNQTTFSSPEIPGVNFAVFVSERFDVLSITTEIQGNPSTIRVGVNSQTELVLDEEIDSFEATIAVSIYGTLYKEMMLPVKHNQSESSGSLLTTFRLCLQFIEEFVPILERFIDEVLSSKAIELHNKAVEQRSWE